MPSYPHTIYSIIPKPIHPSFYTHVQFIVCVTIDRRKTDIEYKLVYVKLLNKTEVRQMHYAFPNWMSVCTYRYSNVRNHLSDKPIEYPEILQ